MTKVQSRWEIKEYDAEKVALLAKEFNLSQLEAIILYNRGFDTIEKAKKFLFPDVINDLENPFVFKDMEKSVLRIRDAIEKKEKIHIFGDKDVDGISSAVMLYKALTKLNADVEYTIHSRKSGGYGISENIIENLYKKGVKLLITVDTGIKSEREVNLANSKGIDVIITDHHLPGNSLPPAFAIINPHLPYEKCRFKELAGAGVTYKLVIALFLSYHKYYLKNFVVFNIKTDINIFEKKILEISALKIRNNLIIDEFHKSLNSENKGKIIEEFYNFIGDAPLITYNAKIYLEILNNYIKDFLNIQLSNEVIDLSELIYSKYRKKCDISTLIKDMELELPDKDGLTESQYNVRIYFEIFKKLIYSGFKKIIKVIDSFSDLASLGTLADVVPVLDENRIILKRGIEQLKQSDIVGLDVLYEMLNINKKDINSKILAWNIIPILNAAGRKGQGKEEYVARLLITDDIQEAKEIAEFLKELNQERKETQNQNLEKIFEILPQKVDIENDKIFVIDIDNIESGVTGVLANRIKDIFFRPVVIIILKDDKASGSARSIDTFNIAEAFKKCEDLLKPHQYGGHKYAFGFAIEPYKIQDLKNRLKEIAEQMIKPEDLIPVISIDAELGPEILNIDVIENLINLFEPYGEDNEEPIFLIRNCKLYDVKTIGKKEQALRLTLSKENIFPLSAILWQPTKEKVDILQPGKFFDVVCKLEIEKWNENKNIKILIEDLKEGGT